MIALVILLLVYFVLNPMIQSYLGTGSGQEADAVSEPGAAVTDESQ